jgi:hypothetical protein
MAALSGQGVWGSWRPTPISAGALLSLSRGRRSTWLTLACQRARRGEAYAPDPSQWVTFRQSVSSCK